MTDPTTPPGWYDDGNGAQRYWDGVQWTDQTQAPGVGTQAGQPMPGFPSLPPASGGGVNKKVLGIAAAAAGLVLVVVVVLAVAFGGGGSPEDVTEDFAKASLGLDLKKTCELSTSDARRDMWEEYDVDSCGELSQENLRDLAAEEGSAEDFEDLLDMTSDVDVDVEVVDFTERGDAAEVEIRVDLQYDGDNQELFDEYFGDIDSEATTTALLKKEDGDWLIDDWRE